MKVCRYIHDVLQLALVSFMQTLRNSILQQDNASLQTANVTGSDLSSIEHVWDIIELRLRLDLQRHLEVSWNKIPKQDIDHQLQSIPRRISANVIINFLTEI